MAADRERVEAAMLAAVRTSDDYLTEIASHLITAGGKRLRPVMAIAASLVATGGSAAEEAIKIDTLIPKLSIAKMVAIE